MRSVSSMLVAFLSFCCMAVFASSSPAVDPTISMVQFGVKTGDNWTYTPLEDMGAGLLNSEVGKVTRIAGVCDPEDGAWLIQVQFTGGNTVYTATREYCTWYVEFPANTFPQNSVKNIIFTTRSRNGSNATITTNPAGATITVGS